MKLSVMIWLLILMGCSSTPEVKYVEKIVVVNKVVPPQFTELCDVPKREDDKVISYITSEKQLRNALLFCNEMISARNKHEQDIHQKLSEENKQK